MSEARDLYQDYYRLFEITTVSDLFLFKEVSHSVRDYMPHCSTNFSPFLIRDREVKRREDSNSAQQSSLPALLLFSSWTSKPKAKTKASSSSSAAAPSSSNQAAETKNPSVAGTSSTASNTGSKTSDSEDEDETATSDEFDLFTDHEDFSLSSLASSRGSRGSMAFGALFDGSHDHYGFEMADPESNDVTSFRTYSHNDDSYSTHGKCHDYQSSLWPDMHNGNQDLYQGYAKLGQTAKSSLTDTNLSIYESWSMNYQLAFKAC